MQTSQGTAQGAVRLEIPNDTMSHEFFEAARWNWSNLAQARELHSRLAQKSPLVTLLLEIGNENEGSYGVIAIIKSSCNDALLLTTYDSKFVELKYIREVPFAPIEVDRLLAEVESIREFGSDVPHDQFFISDSSAYFLSWHTGKDISRLSLFQSLVGSKRRTVGNDQADRDLEIANKVISEMQSFAMR